MLQRRPGGSWLGFGPVNASRRVKLWKRRLNDPAFNLTNFEREREHCGGAHAASMRLATGAEIVFSPPALLHQISNKLVKTHDRLVIEVLNVTGMLRNHRLAQAISDAGWTKFARLLAYKQAWRYGEVAVADRWFPSSKTCSGCGTLRARMGLDERTYRCDSCGVVLDRDLNAAINLATWAETNHARVPGVAVCGHVGGEAVGKDGLLTEAEQQATGPVQPWMADRGSPL